MPLICTIHTCYSARERLAMTRIAQDIERHTAHIPLSETPRLLPNYLPELKGTPAQRTMDLEMDHEQNCVNVWKGPRIMITIRAR